MINYKAPTGRHFSISSGESALIRSKSKTNGMTSTQGLDIKKGQYAGRFVKFEARNVSYELVSLTPRLWWGLSAWREWGGGGLPFMILQKIQDATEAMARERETWMKVIMSLLRAG